MDGNERPPRPGRGRAPRPAFWLLTRRRRGRTEVLAAELVVGARALAVFSFSEEARLFVGLGPLEGPAGVPQRSGRENSLPCCSVP